ncbi:hypothetical protein R3P38DRAFT_3228655 [Favolaschia claudopus]|uniref:Uncharacterized protein n=1 Tax=Favolaschia claudopus TaxID=2862362 RepID=A0AAV9ZQ21_9AGAR
MRSSLTTISFNDLSRASALHLSSRDAAHLSSHDDAPYLVPPYSTIYRCMPPIFLAFVRLRRSMSLNDLPLSFAMQMRLSLTTRISYPESTIYSPSFSCMLYPRPSIIPLFSDGADSSVFDGDLTERIDLLPFDGADLFVLGRQLSLYLIVHLYSILCGARALAFTACIPLYPLSWILHPLSSLIQSCSIVAGTDALVIDAYILICYPHHPLFATHLSHPLSILMLDTSSTHTEIHLTTFSFSAVFIHLHPDHTSSFRPYHSLHTPFISFSFHHPFMASV